MIKFLNSIRANQHTETIQAQYAVLQQQKEDLSARLSEADDRESKNKAALTNLQCVLEQFQKGSCLYPFNCLRFECLRNVGF